MTPEQRLALERSNHCTCQGCRAVYARRLGEPCPCPNCNGPYGNHVALYNRYRPSRLA